MTAVTLDRLSKIYPGESEYALEKLSLEIESGGACRTAWPFRMRQDYNHENDSWIVGTNRRGRAL